MNITGVVNVSSGDVATMDPIGRLSFGSRGKVYYCPSFTVMLYNPLSCFFPEINNGSGAERHRDGQPILKVPGRD